MEFAFLNVLQFINQLNIRMFKVKMNIKSEENNLKGEDGESEQVACYYEVQQILEKRLKKGKEEFLVKWVGYQKPSWQPHDNIEAQMINDFEKNSMKRSKSIKNCQEKMEYQRLKKIKFNESNVESNLLVQQASNNDQISEDEEIGPRCKISPAYIIPTRNQFQRKQIKKISNIRFNNDRQEWQLLVKYKKEEEWENLNIVRLCQPQKVLYFYEKKYHENRGKPLNINL